ncbi:MAG: hypothetical protein ACRDWA_16955 [Acidimicrobiia bacterium]
MERHTIDVARWADRLRPTHGGGESPTAQISIRAPVAGATARPLERWTNSTEADDDGNTILTWTGRNPSDQVGAFPVTFTPVVLAIMVAVTFIRRRAG